MHSIRSCIRQIFAFLWYLFIYFYNGLTVILLGKMPFLKLVKIESPSRTVELPSHCFRSHEIYVVMQGPLYPDVTVETLKDIKHKFPGIHVVYAMWLNDFLKYGAELEALGVDCFGLQDPGPEYNNQNRMIFSVRSALLHVEAKFGNKFVLRLRSDQRLTMYNWPSTLKCLIDNFSPDATSPLQNRIGTTSSSSGKFRPFMVGDQCQFGYVNDLLMFWDVEWYQDGAPKLLEKFNFFNGLKNGLGLLGENYIALSFVNKFNLHSEFTLDEGYKFIARNVLIVDDSTIGLVWYRPQTSRRLGLVVDIEPHYGSVQRPVLQGSLAFSEWLELWQSDGCQYSWTGVSAEKWEVVSWKNRVPIYRILELGGQIADGPKNS